LRTSNGVSTNQTTKERPWHSYRGEPNWKDLIPGYAGALDDEQVSYIQEHLTADSQLSYWWGYRPKAKRRAVDSIKRVAYYGDPENRSHNVKLVREANRRAKADSDGAGSCVTKAVTPPAPRLGRKRIESWETTLLKLANEGLGLRAIADRLQGEGVDISYRTVGRRLQELRGLQGSLVS
jgi:hypothetical protein